MKKVLCFLSIALFHSILSAQGIVPPNSEDIRSIGMGKTGVAGMQGSNAIFTNPALIGGLTETKISGGGRVQGGLVDDEAIEYEAKQYESTYSAYYPPHVKFTHLSLAAPFKIPNAPVSIGAGIGYHTLLDYGMTTYEELKTPMGTGKTTTDISGGLNTITTALSIGLIDKIFLGFSVNKSILGKLTYEEEMKVTGEDTEKSKSVMKTSAFYSAFGGMVKPVPELQIGLSYTSSFDWNWEEGEDDSMSVSLDDEITIPGIFAIGIEYQLAPQFKIAVEYQNRPFSDIEFNGEKADGIEDGFAFRSGIEILAGSVPLRLGFFAESLPITDAIANEDEPKTEIGATGGFGIPMGAAILEMGMMWGTYSQESRFASSKKFTKIEHQFRFDLGLTINLGTPDLSSMGMSSTGTTTSARPVQQPAVVTPPPAPAPAPQPAVVAPPPAPAPVVVPEPQPASE